MMADKLVVHHLKIFFGGSTTMDCAGRASVSPSFWTPRALRGDTAPRRGGWGPPLISTMDGYGYGELIMVKFRGWQWLLTMIY